MGSMQGHGRVLVVVLGALALVAIAGTTALAGKGLKTKSETVEVDPGENGSATATCKRGTKAVSGGFEAEYDGDFSPFLLPSESRKLGGREWTSAAYNTSAESSDLTSFAYCRDQKLRTKSATESVDSSDLDSVTARCKRGEKAFSGGFAAEEIDLAAPTTPVFLPTQSLKQGKREWTVSAYNAGNDEGDLTAYVHCREGKSVKTKQAEETLGSGEFDSAEARCSRKQRVVSGGFDTDSDFATTGAYLMESQKLGKRSWEIAAQEAAGGPTIVAYAYCEKKKKG
jgi:hypothetical protein